MYICLPQSLTDVKKFAASLSHIATHVIDVCPHKRERKQDILTSFKRPKCPIRENKRLHLKCCLVFENNKSK